MKREQEYREQRVWAVGRLVGFVNMGEQKQVKGGGQRVVRRMKDTARLGRGESGMSRGAEVQNGTIGGIGVEAG